MFLAMSVAAAPVPLTVPVVLPAPVPVPVPIPVRVPAAVIPVPVPLPEVHKEVRCSDQSTGLTKGEMTASAGSPMHLAKYSSMHGSSSMHALPQLRVYADLSRP